MGIDVVDLRSFYGSPLGRVAARLVGRAVDNFWGQTAGLRVLGLGYATPYLAPVRPAPSGRSPSCPQARAW